MTFDNTLTELTLWEEYVLRMVYHTLPENLQRYQEDYGLFQTCSAAAEVAAEVDALWDKLQGADYLMDGIAFDFEFVPQLFKLDLFDSEFTLKAEAYEVLSKWRDDVQARHAVA